MVLDLNVGNLNGVSHQREQKIGFERQTADPKIAENDKKRMGRDLCAQAGITTPNSSPVTELLCEAPPQGRMFGAKKSPAKAGSEHGIGTHTAGKYLLSQAVLKAAQGVFSAPVAGGR